MIDPKTLTALTMVRLSTLDIDSRSVSQTITELLGPYNGFFLLF